MGCGLGVFGGGLVKQLALVPTLTPYGASPNENPTERPNPTGDRHRWPTSLGQSSKVNIVKLIPCEGFVHMVPNPYELGNQFC
jgi:hypothetical protein